MHDRSEFKELAAAIIDGAFEQPLWRGFLDKLRTATGADNATLIYRPPGRPLSEALHLYSGVVQLNDIDSVYSRYLSSLELLSDFGMVESRIYTFDDVYPPGKEKHQAFFREVIIPSGINAARMLRVTEPSGVSAWLTISRVGKNFGSHDDAVLQDLAPILRGALRNYVMLEQERFKSALASDAMRRLYFAWLTLDANGNILDHDPEVNKVFEQSGVLSRVSSGRLNITPPSLERQVLQAVEDISGMPHARPRAFTLKWEPWLDILLMPAAQTWLTVNPRATVVAYLHGDSWQASDRCEQLVQLFGLSRGEARIALALSRGMSINEAAVEFGLMVGTARKYTKTIYAKIGARGLPDLVRIVMRSVLALAPDR